MPAANMMIAKISVMLPADSLPKSSAPKKPPASTPKPTAMDNIRVQKRKEKSER